MTLLVPLTVGSGVAVVVWGGLALLVWIARGRDREPSLVPVQAAGRHRLEDARTGAFYLAPVIAARDAEADAAQAHMAAAVRVETGR